MAPDQARPNTWSGTGNPARPKRRRASRAQGPVTSAGAGAMRARPRPARFAAPAARAAPARRSGGHLQDQSGDGGMQVEMLVGVDMIQPKPGGAKGIELGFDLVRRAGGAPWAGRTSPRRPAPCRCGNSRRHRPGRASWPAAGSVCPRPAPDAGPRARTAMALARATASAAAGAPTIRLAAVRMPSQCALLDRVIDLARSAEIVGGDDEAFMAWPGRRASRAWRRSRRNWKNSTPSRSRRFIMSVRAHHLAHDRGDLARPEIELRGRSPPANRKSPCGSDAGSAAARSGCRARPPVRHWPRRASHSAPPDCRGRCPDRARPATPARCAD